MAIARRSLKSVERDLFKDERRNLLRLGANAALLRIVVEVTKLAVAFYPTEKLRQIHPAQGVTDRVAQNALTNLTERSATVAGSFALVDDSLNFSAPHG